MTAAAIEPADDTSARLIRIFDAARLNQTSRAALLITSDPDAGIATMCKAAAAAQAPLHALSMANQRILRPGTDSFEAISGPAGDPLDVLRSAMNATGPALILFQDMLRFVGDAAGDHRARAQLLQMTSNSNRRPHLYVFGEPPEGESLVPSFARSLLARVSVPLPCGHELIIIAREELAIAAARAGKALAAESLRPWASRFAAELPGLSQGAARFAMQDVLSGTFDLDAAVRGLAARKAEHLQAQLAMQVLQSASDPPVGMERYYEWLRIYGSQMCVPGADRVKGAVLLGPPGTGKTRLGGYTAHHLGVPGVWFRFGALLGMYVGQSEAAADRAFSVLDALGANSEAGHERGVVVVLDELEKTIGRTDHDGGVMMRVTARLLNWMSESRAPNMMLATANDLESMGDLADIITRRGRLDRIFFVDVPNRRGRRALFERLLGGTEASGALDLDELGGRSERFSGADIEGVVRDARAEARDAKRGVTMADIFEQIRRSRVRVLARYERFNRVREWARLNAEMAGLEDENQ